jgi:hypothetical protein
MDDGCGIAAEEVPLAFARHATSKLTSVEDLNRVMTLGFRGEALASVAAVSQLTLLSRPASQQAAARIRLEGGQQVSLKPAGSPAGTIITIENLFYNVPARLKFLMSSRKPKYFTFVSGFQGPPQRNFILFLYVFYYSNLHIWQCFTIFGNPLFEILDTFNLFSSMINYIRSNKVLCLLYFPFIKYLLDELPRDCLVFCF